MFNDDKLTPAQRKMLQEADDNADKVYMDDPGDYIPENKKENLNKMTNTQKVRVLRKYARKLMEVHEEQARDMMAFHAPAECWGIIEEGNARRVREVFERLNMTIEEFHEEANKQIKLEAEAIDMPVVGDWDDVPNAYYETAEILVYV